MTTFDELELPFIDKNALNRKPSKRKAAKESQKKTRELIEHTATWVTEAGKRDRETEDYDPKIPSQAAQGSGYGIRQYFHPVAPAVHSPSSKRRKLDDAPENEPSFPDESGGEVSSGHAQQERPFSPAGSRDPAETSVLRRSTAVTENSLSTPQALSKVAALEQTATTNAGANHISRQYLDLEAREATGRSNSSKSHDNLAAVSPAVISKVNIHGLPGPFAQATLPAVLRSSTQPEAAAKTMKLLAAPSSTSAVPSSSSLDPFADPFEDYHNEMRNSPPPPPVPPLVRNTSFIQHGPKPPLIPPLELAPATSSTPQILLRRCQDIPTSTQVPVAVDDRLLLPNFSVRHGKLAKSQSTLKSATPPQPRHPTSPVVSTSKFEGNTVVERASSREGLPISEDQPVQSLPNNHNSTLPPNNSGNMEVDSDVARDASVSPSAAPPPIEVTTILKSPHPASTTASLSTVSASGLPSGSSTMTRTFSSRQRTSYTTFTSMSIIFAHKGHAIKMPTEVTRNIASMLAVEDDITFTSLLRVSKAFYKGVGTVDDFWAVKARRHGLVAVPEGLHNWRAAYMDFMRRKQRSRRQARREEAERQKVEAAARKAAEAAEAEKRRLEERRKEEESERQRVEAARQAAELARTKAAEAEKRCLEGVRLAAEEKERQRADAAKKAAELEAKEAEKRRLEEFRKAEVLARVEAEAARRAVEAEAHRLLELRRVKELEKEKMEADRKAVQLQAEKVRKLRLEQEIRAKEAEKYRREILADSAWQTFESAELRRLENFQREHEATGSSASKEPLVTKKRKLEETQQESSVKHPKTLAETPQHGAQSLPSESSSLIERMQASASEQGAVIFAKANTLPMSPVLAASSSILATAAWTSRDALPKSVQTPSQMSALTPAYLSTGTQTQKPSACVSTGIPIATPTPDLTAVQKATGRPESVLIQHTTSAIPATANSAQRSISVPDASSIPFASRIGPPVATTPAIQSQTSKNPLSPINNPTQAHSPPSQQPLPARKQKMEVTRPAIIASTGIQISDEERAIIKLFAYHPDKSKELNQIALFRLKRVSHKYPMAWQQLLGKDIARHDPAYRLKYIEYMLEIISSFTALEAAVKSKLVGDPRNFDRWILEAIDIEKSMGTVCEAGPETWLDKLIWKQKTGEEFLEEVVLAGQRWCAKEGCWHLSGAKCTHSRCGRCCEGQCSYKKHKAWKTPKAIVK